MAYEDPRGKERDEEQDSHRAQDSARAPESGHGNRHESLDEENRPYRYSDWASI